MKKGACPGYVDLGRLAEAKLRRFRELLNAKVFGKAHYHLLEFTDVCIQANASW